MNVALLQLHVEGGDLEANTERAIRGIEDATEDGADLIVLPELWNVGYFADETFDRAAEPLSGPTLSRIGDLASAHNVSILAGSVIEDLAATDSPTPSDTGLANTSVLFGSEGDRLVTYRKHHLFGYESAESERLVPGERVAVTELGDFTVGITTCYDLRFPELYRVLLDRGVTLLLVPSAWPYPRLEHWTTLTEARALENLSYLVAVNGAGPAGGAGLVGRSRVVDPWGTVMRALGPESGVANVDLDPDHVAEVREEFPALRDRRLGTAYANDL